MGILMTLMLALALSMLPMPGWTVWLRPAWVPMVLIYWSMVVPHRVNVGVAWLVGIILDLMTGTLLGEHALALIIVVYLVSGLHMRLRLYPLIQQAMTVFAFILLYQFIIYLVQGFIGQQPQTHLYWLASLTSMLLWPWLAILLRDYRRWLRLA